MIYNCSTKTRCPLYPPDETTKHCSCMLSPVSRKGSVLHYKFTPVKSRACVLHMCVAQSPACHALTDRRPQRAEELREACRERARDKNAGIVRTITRRGCRTPLTRCAM